MRRLRIFCAAIIIMAAGCGDPYQEGLDLLAHGEFEKAAQYFLEQTKKHPDDPRAFNELGYSYVRLKMYDKASEAYNTAIKLKPDYLEAHLNLGTMHLYKMDPQNAYYELTKAIRIDPNCEACRVNLAWTYIVMNRFDQAKEQIDKAAAIAGSDKKYAKVAEAIRQGKEKFDKEVEEARKKAEKKEAQQPSSPEPLKLITVPAIGSTVKPGGTE
jgi:Flp pilus assembly protein TadD